MITRGQREKINYPKFKDFKRTDDGVMVADLGFKRQLWTLDPELDVVWDWGSCRWEIWKFPGQKNVKKKVINKQAHQIMTVQTKGRTFRELGADILLKLRWGDTSKYSLNELCAYFDKMDENIQRAKAKAFTNYIHDVAMDSFDFVRGVLKVPVSVKIKASDQKYVLPFKVPKPNIHIFKPRMTQVIANAVGGDNA
jgi:hypothetical protein